MRLEKVVSRPQKGVWVFLFVLGLAVVGVMATVYNVEVAHDVNFENLPWLKIVLGSLGFFGILGALVLFFLRLLREMRVSQIQADFLDRISHELRTPLSTLTLVADLLKNEKNSEEEIDRLWRAHETELTRLKTDVELLLQAARLREAKLQVERVTFDLEEWISGRSESLTGLLGPGARFSRSGPALKGLCEFDSVLMELIFRNLFDNARKFSVGVPVVELKTELFSRGWFRNKKKWRIIVLDQGLGFQPSQQSLLFRRFARLPFQRADLKSSSIPGTGLGLYLAATASRAMGLTLEGMSAGEGKGAQFVLEGGFK